jgi:opine dehydrogenase
MSAGGKIGTIAIIGAGNGGCAAVADLTVRGFDVRLYGRSAGTVAPLQERGGVEYEGALGEGFASLVTITNDVAAAMDGADLVLIMGPTHAHEDIARVIAPHLHTDQLVMAAPGHTLLLIPNAIRKHGGRLGVYCDSATLPYICRKISPVRVRISRAAQTMLFAVFPAADTGLVARRVKPVLPRIEPRPSLLHTVFPYTNAIHHPAALLLNVGRVESTGGDYYHYYDGITPGVGRLIDALDRERVAVAKAFGVMVEPLPDYFFRLGYTDAEGQAGGGAYSVFHHSEPNRWIKAPASIDHRFFNEDVPYGLVAISELGRLAGVPTPEADAVIAIASTVSGRAFRAEGLTLERMGVAGLGPVELVRLLETDWPDQLTLCQGG